MTPHKLKRLEFERSKLIEQKNINPDFDQHDKLDVIERELAAAKSEPHITEHALLRYCERALGINLDAVAQRIEQSPPKGCKNIENMRLHMGYDANLMQHQNKTMRDYSKSHDI